MAESVKDLVVRLAFEHGDTKSQIAAIKNEIKLLDTDFKAAAVSASGFSGGMNEAGARAQLLRQQIALQEQAVQKYGTAIEQAQQKLQQAQQRQTDYTNKLQAAKQRHEELTAEIKQTKQAMAETKKTTGENSDEYKELQSNLDNLQKELQENNQEIKQWETSLKRSDTAIANADKSVQRLTMEQNQAKIAAGQMRQALDQMTTSAKSNADALRAASEHLAQYAESAKNAGQWQEKVGQTLTKGSVAIVGAGVAAAGAAISWESSCAEMEKTISGTDEQLQQIEDGMLEMSKVKPVDAGTLAEIAANAGQLGVATGDIQKFTSTIADMTATTDLSAESAAASFAQYANVTRMNMQDVDRLASTVVELGNNTATTESAIVAMGTNLASAGHQIGLTDAQIMGIAASLSSLGLESQAGGTAFSKLFVNMQVAAETGSDKLAEFAEVAGMSASEFATAFKSDAAGAITSFVQGLSSGSQSAIVMLDEMGITETRMRDALLRASNASEMFQNNIQMAGNAWQQNTALAAEADKRYSTTASRLQMVGNKAKAAAINFGNDLMPAISDGVDWISDLVDKFGELDEGQRKQIMTWAAYAAAVGPAMLVLGKANTTLGNVASGLSKLAGVAADAGGGLSGLWAVAKNVLGPAGLAALAVGAGAATVAFIDWASGAKQAREATEDLVEIAQTLRETQAQTIYDTGNSDPLARFGVSKEAFGNLTASSETWLSELKRVWSDGAKESDEIVQQFADGFIKQSDSVRDKIEQRGSLLEGLGTLTPEATAKMEADKAKLDSYDQEIQDLLKKRQNGLLSDKDQQRLDQVIKLRAELELEYGGGETDGYQQILDGMQAEIDRMLARGMGKEADPSLYGDTLNALAEGRKEYMDTLDQSYNAQHAEIMQIQDETERQAALNALNQQYNQQRQQGEQRYREAVQEAGQAALEGMDYSEQLSQIDQLAKLLQGGDLDPTQALDWAQNLDEGQLTSMLALIEQLKAAGTTDSQFAEMGIDVDDLYTKLTQIRDITAELGAGGNEGAQAINEIVAGAIPEELQRILVGLDMSQAEADWAAFAEGKDPWEASGKMTISEVDETAIANWQAANAETPITGPAVKLGVALGDGWSTQIQTAIDSGMLSVYGPDGKKIPITPEVQQQIGPDDIVLTGEDGTLHVILTPEVSPTAAATVNIQLSPLDQAAITAWEAANSGKTLKGPPAKVGVELGSDWQTQLTTALNSGMLTVTGVNGVPVTVTPEVLEQITVNDLAAVEEDGTIHVIITPDMGTTEAVDAANTQADQTPLDGTPFAFLSSSTNDSTSAIAEMNTELTSLQERIAALKESGSIWDENGFSVSDLQQQANSLQSGIVQSLSDLDETDLTNISSQIATLTAALANPDLDPETVEQYRTQLEQLQQVVGAADQYLGTGNNVSAGIAQGMTAYGWGGDASTLASNITQAINGALGVASPATTMVPTGQFVAAGIAEGMGQFPFGSAAAAITAQIIAAMALLPAQGVLIGMGFGAGLQGGMQGGTAGAVATASSCASQISGAFAGLPAQGRSIGSAFGAGLKAGLQSQLSSAVAQARSYANQITAAFKGAWQIHSPSKVAENLTTMFGKGLEKGERNWPTVSEDLLERDLQRLYAPQRTVQQPVNNSSVTNDDHSSVVVNVDKLDASDRNDVRGLAYEIAGLTRKRQRGFGKR